MVKSAQSTIPPTESDFNDSHPAQGSNPALGDLSTLESEIVTPTESSMQLGDISQMNSDDDEHNDVLGDITLLEEAFAELEDSANSMLSNESALESMEIPTLSDSVEPPTSLSLSQLESMEEELSKSIPTLDQQATVYEEMACLDNQDNSEVEQSLINGSETIDVTPTISEPDTFTPASNFVTSETHQSNAIEVELLETAVENLSEAFEALSDDEIASSLSQAEISSDQPPEIEEPLSLDQQATAHEETAASDDQENNEIEQSALSDNDEIDVAPTISSESEPDAGASTPASNFITIESDVVEAELLEAADENLSIENLSEAFEVLNADEIANSLSQTEVSSDQPSEIEIEEQPTAPDTIDSIIDSAISQQQSVLTAEQDEQKSQAVQSEPEQPLLTDEDLSLAYEQSLSRFAEDLESEELILEQLDVDSENSIPDFIDTTFPDSIADSVDAKIAQATESGTPDANGIPLDNPMESEAVDFEQSGLIDNNSVSEFAEDLVMTEIADIQSEADMPSQEEVAFDSGPFASEIKEVQSELLAPEETIPEQAPTHAEHSVAIGESANFSLNIPFELHSQLSQKIDSLVIEATTSLTHELHIQLADRMESLLSNSVESVLPRLIEQMAGELRREVKSQVKTQLPIIINDVLGKTRLSK